MRALTRYLLHWNEICESRNNVRSEPRSLSYAKSVKAAVVAEGHTTKGKRSIDAKSQTKVYLANVVKNPMSICAGRMCDVSRDAPGRKNRKALATRMVPSDYYGMRQLS